MPHSTISTAPASVAIVGGGPAGLALAGILERHGIDYVVYEHSARKAPPRGGCLDLHPSGGQEALKEAGCFDEFQKYGRAGWATMAWVLDDSGNRVFSFGEGRDSPEIDRAQLRRVLMTSVPEQRMRWSTTVVGAERDQGGKIVLSFSDGTSASGFKLVVGADGAKSHIRHLVTSAEPAYTGYAFLTAMVRPENPWYETLESHAGLGPMVILGRGKKIWCQRQGDGHYRIDYGWAAPADFPKGEKFDISDEFETKKFLLQEEYFGGHCKMVQDMIKHCTGPFWMWPLFYMPLESLDWAPLADVTLIGDAAHVTPPFVGDGVNFAMRDSVILAHKLRDLGVGKEAVAAYEAAMFPYAIDVISRSIEAGGLWFHKDGVRAFTDDMASVNRLVGARDHA